MRKTIWRIRIFIRNCGRRFVCRATGRPTWGEQRAKYLRDTYNWTPTGRDEKS
jgi:hypothetical protein